MLDRLLKLNQGGIGKARQVLGLVDQRVGGVLQGLNLIVDLLQLTGGGQQVPPVVGAVEDGNLSGGGESDGRRHCGGCKLRRPAVRRLSPKPRGFTRP